MIWPCRVCLGLDWTLLAEFLLVDVLFWLVVGMFARPCRSGCAQFMRGNVWKAVEIAFTVQALSKVQVPDRARLESRSQCSYSRFAQFRDGGFVVLWQNKIIDDRRVIYIACRPRKRGLGWEDGKGSECSVSR